MSAPDLSEDEMLAAALALSTSGGPMDVDDDTDESDAEELAAALALSAPAQDSGDSVDDEEDEAAVLAAALALSTGGRASSDDGAPPPAPPLVRVTSGPRPSFVRLEQMDEVSRESLDAINAMYHSDGIKFTDPDFPPLPRSLYSSAASETTWKCRACQTRNPLPAHSHSAEDVIALMRAPSSRTIACATCGAVSSELEVAMRPSGWMRPAFLRDDLTMMASTTPWVVFREQPRPDDIRQGGVGNCWFVCALSILAQRPELVRRVLLTDEFNPAAAYRVRLCRAGTWHTVLVDDTLPINALGMLAYLKAARRSLWGALIEKAAAKLWGSYEALAGGTFAEAFAMLTGFPVQTIRLGRLKRPEFRDADAETRVDATKMARRDVDIAKVNAEWVAEHGSEEEACDELFGQLYSYMQSGFLVGASSFIVPGSPSQDALLAEARGSGLQVPHAYGVLDVVALAPDTAVDFGASKGRAQRLVKLRNPNGRAGWKGAWAYDARGAGFHSADPRWTWSRRQQLKLSHEDQGVFWMGMDDFFKLFAEITVCRMLDDHLEARLPGWLASAFGPGEALALDVFKHTRIEVTAYQEGHSSRGEGSHKTLVDLGVCVLKCQSASARAAAELSGGGGGGAFGGGFAGAFGGGFGAFGSRAAGSNPHGSLVARAERVAHGAGAHCSATLPHDDYPTTRYVILPLCFGHARSMEPRKFMVALHSPSPLTIETVPVSAPMLASALIEMTVQNGKRGLNLVDTSKIMDADVCNVYSLHEEAGIIVVAENLTNNAYFRVECEADSSIGCVRSLLVAARARCSAHSPSHSPTHTPRCRYVSTRNVLFCQDVLPPRSRQVLFILSVDIAKKRHAAGLGFSARMVDGAGGDFAHVPALANLGELEGLHTPLPIYTSLEGADAEQEEDGVGGVDTTSLADSLRSLMSGGGGGGSAPAAATPAGALDAKGGAEAAAAGAAGSAASTVASLSAASEQRVAATDARAAAAATGVAASAAQPAAADEGAAATDPAAGRKRSRANDALPATSSPPAQRASLSTRASPAARLPESLASAAERDAFDLVRKIVDNLLTKTGAKYRRLPRTNAKLVRVLFSCASAVRALVDVAVSFCYVPLHFTRILLTV